jgi:membrane protein insertase Oxa1/YidC/SpoIIIJ
MPIGLLIIMAASMFLQTKLNPTPPDPVQAKVMMFMPLVFSFMFFFFPSGLVLYWVTNNILSIAQQWVITRNIESGKTNKPALQSSKEKPVESTGFFSVYIRRVNINPAPPEGDPAAHHTTTSSRR